MTSPPLITLFVYAFNHEKYIRDAVSGAFAQTYSPLEIVLSDDCSTDGTYEIMHEMAGQYRGPHRVITNRNETNQGITAHLNKIMEMSSGEWFVLGAGDDISLPQRVETIAQIIEEYPDIYAVGTGLLLINEEGQTIGYHPIPDHHPYITGASMAWSRSCWETLGPITADSTAEDVIIPFRALLLGKLALVDAPTVKYRQHADSVSSPALDDQLLALKHLRRIKNTLIAACRQRLEDLEHIQCSSQSCLHSAIEERHTQIIKELEESKQRMHQTISLWEAGTGMRLAYLLGMETFTGPHRNLVYRIKNALLASRYMRSGYFGLQRRLRRLQHPNAHEPTERVRVIELDDLRDPQVGPLIYL